MIQRFSPEDYKRGFRSTPAEDAKLVHVDAETNRVVAEIPVEETAIEGGASDVAVGGDAVWVTSVNGKLNKGEPSDERGRDRSFARRLLL